MSRRIAVYVSATADLESEREVIGEALARFPVPLAWEIRRTPHRGEQGLAALAPVADSDFFLLLLGQDVTAPIGAELEEAVAHRLPLLALVKDTAHTPAGRFFRHTSIDTWERFADSRGLRLTVSRFLARHLVEEPLAHALSPSEAATLEEYLHRPEKGQAAAAQDAVTGGEPAGAQEGAVIVAGGEPRRTRRAGER
ncbi:MAG: hypothetical protein ACYC5O_01320 [Anaerolineae bacterium]